MVWYFSLSGNGPSWGKAVLDIALAYGFLQLARRSMFALPLFVIHLALVVFYFVTTIFGIEPWWIVVFVNRVFEMCLFYVGGAGIARIIYRWRVTKNLPHDANGHNFVIDDSMQMPGA